MRDFRKYDIWRDAVGFATDVYKLTSTFPKFEIYGLCDQMQRASVSISSNIAEGCSRESEKDFANGLADVIENSSDGEDKFIASLILAKEMANRLNGRAILLYD